MRRRKHEPFEILIPHGYEIEDMLDMDDDLDEPPIKTEEVKLRFE